MRFFAKWFFMLCKRLYKKASFIAILVMILLSVLALTASLKEESGFVKIALAAADPSDPIASKVIEDFLNEETMMVFLYADTAEQAIDAVKNSDADAAWIFSQDMSGKIAEYVRKKSRKDAAIRVVVKEQTVFTRIAQEKLSAAMFEYCAREEFVLFAQEQVPELARVSREKLCNYFENIAISEDLFEIKNTDGAVDDTDSNYLASPIRGILSLFVLLAAFAGAMFNMQDEKRGAFAKVPEGGRFWLSFLSVTVATLNVAVVSVAALFLAGLGRGIFAEAVNMAVYVLSCSAFALLLKEVLGSLHVFAAGTPVLMLAMIAVCPIFLGLPAASHLFVPTFYINASQNATYTAYCAVYGAVCLTSALIINFLKTVFFGKRLLAKSRD